MIFQPIFRLSAKPATSVFICGCGHTGTSILVRIIAEHPAVFSPPYETGAFLGAKGTRWRKLVKELWLQRLSGRPVFVEKTPRHVRKLDLIRDAFPDAKLIVTTREGRDVVASLGKRSGDFEAAFDRWLTDSEYTLAALKQPGCQLWRYEDFIADAPASIAQLCAFIGIEFQPAMLNYHSRQKSWGYARSTDKSENGRLRLSQVNQPIFDGRGRWKTDLPPEMLPRFSTGRPAEILAAFGYSISELTI